MPRYRVFISSVILGFETERAAAKEAVEILRQQPVMAESFGAKPFSPREACLEGVRQSDIYVGIFGSRYGYVTSSGVSVTEEEFLEARRSGLQILCFVQEGNKESSQEEFLNRIMGYEEGYHIARFSTAEELKIKVIQALHDIIGQPDVVTLDSKGAEAHLEDYRWGSRTDSTLGTWLGAVLFPARQGETYISAIDLGNKALEDRLLQPALFGPGAIFRRELGVHLREGEDYLAFEQNDEYRHPVAEIEIHIDGSLVFGYALGSDKHRDSSILRIYLINQDEVQRKLTEFFAYAHQLSMPPRGATKDENVCSMCYPARQTDRVQGGRSSCGAASPCTSLTRVPRGTADCRSRQWKADYCLLLLREARVLDSVTRWVPRSVVAGG